MHFERTWWTDVSRFSFKCALFSWQVECTVTHLAQMGQLLNLLNYAAHLSLLSSPIFLSVLLFAFPFFIPIIFSLFSSLSCFLAFSFFIFYFSLHFPFLIYSAPFYFSFCLLISFSFFSVDSFFLLFFFLFTCIFFFKFLVWRTYFLVHMVQKFCNENNLLFSPAAEGGGGERFYQGEQLLQSVDTLVMTSFKHLYNL